jgi:hypothetical protein
MSAAARIAAWAPEMRTLRMQDPGAHSATAPSTSDVSGAAVRSAKAKPADGPRVALLRNAHGHPDAGAGV